MQAFVQVDFDGHFINENHFLAWRGLSYFDYDVKFFKSYEIHRLKLSEFTPVYAGVNTFTNCLYKIGIGIADKELPSYPPSLNEYLGRNFQTLRMSTIKESINNSIPLFLKPLDKDRKSFDGYLVKTQKDLEYFENLPDFWQVYAFEPVNIVSEHRVFIHKGEILDGRKYKGDFTKNINYAIVKNAIRELDKPPVAYCLDFGVTDDDRTILIEATDAWSFSPYGLDMIHFTNMIVDRWKEITS